MRRSKGFRSASEITAGRETLMKHAWCIWSLQESLFIPRKGPKAALNIGSVAN
ncbi:uncharacterized protein BBA_08437 [Beauveria bassiana ARSEF 2860]|uniref:Uncharacterized protein n=1 Tax=Beauveria bassiana (strain ARSEF 2860) TaxID=655819 RepID=J5JG03_BEAB2|nr:uncharacterized protein BBA_08437 [Beauveria bassiana ARSEF 2860]EJP62526.1 hypothetical protein BBA_08437 [Beauveria bassiana ARSEF 2860]